MLAEWEAQFQRRTGHPVTWEPIQRDFPAARRVVARLGADEVIRRVGIRFDAPPAWMEKGGGNPSFKQFFERIDDFTAPARASPPSPQRDPKVGAVMVTGNEKYAGGDVKI